MDLSGLSGLNSNYTSAKTDATSATGNALQSSLKNISSNSSEDELKSVIKDFESYFVEQMLKEVKDTFTSDDEDYINQLKLNYPNCKIIKKSKLYQFNLIYQLLHFFD